MNEVNKLTSFINNLYYKMSNTMSRTISSIKKPTPTKAAILSYIKKDNLYSLYRESIVIHTATGYAYNRINDLLDEFCSTVNKSKPNNYNNLTGYAKVCVRFEGIVDLAFYTYDEVVKYFEDVIDILNDEYYKYSNK